MKDFGRLMRWLGGKFLVSFSSSSTYFYYNFLKFWNSEIQVRFVLASLAFTVMHVPRCNI
jgi:hypothetical protein